MDNLYIEFSPSEETWYRRITLIGPIVCFLAAPAFLIIASKSMSTITVLLLQPKISIYFFPFLIYSIISVNLLLADPISFAPMFIVRLGVYTGFLLAVQYSILVLLIGWDLIFGVMVPPITIMLIMPFANAYIFARVSNKLLSRYELQFINSLILKILAFLVWCLVYRAAWYSAYTKALELYSLLPNNRSSCYVATAASHGHKKLVGRQVLITVEGKPISITKQLLILKCGELAIQLTFPYFHVFLRSIYDTVGPLLAKALVIHPLFADIAYLTLKPFEWLTMMILKTIVPDINEYAGRLYSVSKQA